MTEETLVLAGDFAAPTQEDWHREVLKVLNRKRPPGTELTIDQAMKRLTTITVDGLKIDPLYTIPDDEELGFPAVTPFTRGSRPADEQITLWDVRQLHEDPDVAFTNAEALADLQRGATSLWLRVDADALAPADVAGALAGVHPAMAAVSVSSVSLQSEAATALADFWRASGSVDQVVGNLGIDPIGAAAVTGAPADLSVLPAWAEKAAEFPKARAFVVNVLPYDNAGAGDVDQLAYAIATGIEYARTLAAAGVGAQTAFDQILFRVSASTDQFLTIARLRALRRLWSRVGEVLDVPESSRGALQHAVTSWRMTTRDDPFVNLLRTTIATFGAAVGGADIITSLPFDTAVGLPTPFSRRMARNIQLLAGEESHVGAVTDPAGGSWYVESLTEQLAGKAWQRVQEIEAAGGMAAALADGLIASQIATTAAERTKRLASRKLPVTGVSTFPKEDEQPHTDVRPRPQAPAQGGLRPARDSEVFEGLRDRAIRGAQEIGHHPAVFLACLGARRDFGGREMFTSNLLLVAGLAHPQTEGGTTEEIVEAVKKSGTSFVILCSSAKVYASSAVEVAKALKDSGIDHVWIAGRLKETGSDEAASVIDGEVFDGMDVVSFLTDTLDKLGVSK